MQIKLLTYLLTYLTYNRRRLTAFYAGQPGQASTSTLRNINPMYTEPDVFFKRWPFQVLVLIVPTHRGMARLSRPE